MSTIDGRPTQIANPACPDDQPVSVMTAVVVCLIWILVVCELFFAARALSARPTQHSGTGAVTVASTDKR